MAEQQTIDLGIVAIKNVGAYSSEARYEKLNVVTYEGSSYCALKTTQGNLPTNTEYWQLYAQKGDIGPQGIQGIQGEKGYKGDPGGKPLTASSTSEMTDTASVYVNTTNGHWYTYDGTQWVDGGVYQATELSDGIIGSYNIADKGLKISDLFSSNNTENYSNIIEEYNASYVGGNLVTSTNWMSTKKIPVKKNDIIKVNIDNASTSLTVVELYDENQSYVKNLNINSGVIVNYTVESGIYYARFNLLKSLNSKAINDIFNKYTINNKSIFLKEFLSSLDTIIYPYNFYNVTRDIKKNLLSYIYAEQKAWVYSNNTITLASYSSYTAIKPIELKENDIVEILNVSAGTCLTLVGEDGTKIRDYVVPTGTVSNIQVNVPEDCTGYFNIYNNDYDDYDILINNVHIFDKYKIDWLGIDENKSVWCDKKLEIFGDSLVQGTAQQGNYVTHLSPLIKPEIFTNKGISGRPMANGTPNGVGTNTTINNESAFNYDLIIIAAGTNDFKLNVPLGELGTINDTVLNTNTFYGAYKDALNHILSINPDVRIVLWTPLQRNQSGYDIYYTNSAGHKLIDYVNAIKNIGQLYGIPVIDLYSTSGVNMKTLMNYTYDGLHLSSHGYDLVCRYLCNKLNEI